MKLHVGYPNLPNNDALYVALDDILATHRLTNNGPYVREFEKCVAEFLGVKHCVAVCNATIGLQIVARALELHGEVIMPAWTFVATAHAMEWVGLKPVFCDVTPSHLADPFDIDRLINSDTAAILGVHLWGNPCVCDTLDTLSKEYEVKVFYDAAHAFGCSYGEKKIGNFGNAEVFSFHATKCINSFEGGAITTNDDELAEKCRMMRNFGFVDFDDVRSFGTNGKMSEIHAAMGLAMLDCYDEIVAVNKRNFQLYFDKLSPLVGVFVLEPAYKYDEHNYQYVVIEINQAATGISRDAILTHLHKNGVIARKYFCPGIHRMPPYDTGQSLLFTEWLCERTLVLPTGLAVSEDDIGYICALIEEVVCR